MTDRGGALRIGFALSSGCANKPCAAAASTERRRTDCEFSRQEQQAMVTETPFVRQDTQRPLFWSWKTVDVHCLSVTTPDVRHFTVRPRFRMPFPNWTYFTVNSGLGGASGSLMLRDWVRKVSIPPLPFPPVLSGKPLCVLQTVVVRCHSWWVDHRCRMQPTADRAEYCDEQDEKQTLHSGHQSDGTKP